mmetsp:Transcript_32824/g.75919  ORF Transcript_32824/g.75919 Transcript_32824/m.75919 type:complete len:339 (+) Transcript_32824:722-1738(+)
MPIPCFPCEACRIHVAPVGRHVQNGRVRLEHFSSAISAAICPSAKFRSSAPAAPRFSPGYSRMTPLVCRHDFRWTSMFPRRSETSCCARQDTTTLFASPFSEWSGTGRLWCWCHSRLRLCKQKQDRRTQRRPWVYNQVVTWSGMKLPPCPALTMMTAKRTMRSRILATRQASTMRFLSFSSTKVPLPCTLQLPCLQKAFCRRCWTTRSGSTQGPRCRGSSRSQTRRAQRGNGRVLQPLRITSKPGGRAGSSKTTGPAAWRFMTLRVTWSCGRPPSPCWWTIGFRSKWSVAVIMESSGGAVLAVRLCTWRLRRTTQLSSSSCLSVMRSRTHKTTAESRP